MWFVTRIPKRWDCGEVHAPDDPVELREVWEPQDIVYANRSFDNGILLEEPEATEVYLYLEGTFAPCFWGSEHPPEYHDAFRCGECRELYLNQDEATACCAQAELR